MPGSARSAAAAVALAALVAGCKKPPPEPTAEDLKQITRSCTGAPCPASLLCVQHMGAPDISTCELPCRPVPCPGGLVCIEFIHGPGPWLDGHTAFCRLPKPPE